MPFHNGAVDVHEHLFKARVDVLTGLWAHILSLRSCAADATHEGLQFCISLINNVVIIHTPGCAPWTLGHLQSDHLPISNDSFSSADGHYIHQVVYVLPQSGHRIGVTCEKARVFMPPDLRKFPGLRQP